MEIASDFDVLKLLTSIIGLIGGLLGFYTFIDNNLLKFKPQLNISSRLFFSLVSKEKKQNSIRKIKSIILQVEILNDRSKIGRVDDLSIRIYNSRTTEPYAYMLFATSTFEKLPSTPSLLDVGGSFAFSPISIMGRSAKNVVIEFKSENNFDVILSQSGSIQMELLYYSNKKWKPAGNFRPHNFNEHHSSTECIDTIEYSLLDSSVYRKQASKALKFPKTSMYKGISGKFLRQNLHRPVWLAKKLSSYPLKIFNLAIESVKLILRHIYYKCLALPLVNKKSKKIPRIQIRSARKHLIEDTNKAFDKCKKSITSIAERINLDADEDAKIYITSHTDNFTLRRSSLEIKFYRSGDGYLRVNDSDGFPYKFSFALTLVEFPLGIRLWKLNEKFMTIESACICIMDSFILLAH